MLTIAIPTYNRAQRLDRQLRWLSTALQGFEDRVEILVSDNASTDNTPEVVDFWRQAFEHADFVYRRHPANIGAIPNMISCIWSASREHLWIVSDDDALDEHALEAVLRRLTERPDLGLLTLNHSSRYADGVQRFARCFPVADEYYDSRGMDLAAYCLDFDDAGFGLITAHVFRTDLVRQAQRQWPTGENFVVVTYWAAYCAREGGMQLTAHPYVECTAGDHFWTKDPILDLRMNLAHTPELIEHLAALGYDSRVCRRMTLQRITPRRLRTLNAAIRTSPMATLRLVASFARSLGRVGIIRTLQHFITKVFNRLWGRGKSVDRERMLKSFLPPSHPHLASPEPVETGNVGYGTRRSPSNRAPATGSERRARAFEDQWDQQGVSRSSEWRR